MKKLILILIPTALLLSSPMMISAQTGTNNVDSYSQELETQLMLEMPPVTENPSHAIIFKDPSGKGVSIVIDGKDYGTITSPYSLPTLGIGKHTIELSFKDEEEVSQKVLKDIVIIPRPPRIDTPKIIGNKVNLAGTGVAGGSIEVFISGGLSNYRKEAEIDINGMWELAITEDLLDEKYTVIAITRKNGFASKYSEPVNFEISINGGQTEAENPVVSVAATDIENMSIEELIDYIINSQKLLITSGVLLLIGILLGVLLKFLFTDNSTRKVESLLKNSLGLGNKSPQVNTEKVLPKKKEEEVCFPIDEVKSIKDKLEHGLRKDSEKPVLNEVVILDTATQKKESKESVVKKEVVKNDQKDVESKPIEVAHEEAKTEEEPVVAVLETKEEEKTEKIKKISFFDKLKKRIGTKKEKMGTKIAPEIAPNLIEEENFELKPSLDDSFADENENKEEDEKPSEDMLASFLDNLSKNNSEKSDSEVVNKEKVKKDKTKKKKKK